MRIFAEVPWGGASNDSGIVDNGDFQHRWLFFGNFRDEASIIIIGFSVIPKCMTLNDLDWLFCLKFCFRASLASSDSATFEK